MLSMKQLALLALSSSLCLAQENAPEDTPPPAAVSETPAQAEANAALTEEAKPYLESARSHIELLCKLRDILKPIEDTETANAAAGEVDALAQQVKAAMEQEEKLAEPSQEVQYLVSAETAECDLEELANESIGRAIEFQEMEAPCYGSGALKQALDALLSLYMQDDGEEVQGVDE